MKIKLMICVALFWCAVTMGAISPIPTCAIAANWHQQNLQFGIWVGETWTSAGYYTPQSYNLALSHVSSGGPRVNFACFSSGQGVEPEAGPLVLYDDASGRQLYADSSKQGFPYQFCTNSTRAACAKNYRITNSIVIVPPGYQWPANQNPWIPGCGGSTMTCVKAYCNNLPGYQWIPNAGCISTNSGHTF